MGAYKSKTPPPKRHRSVAKVLVIIFVLGSLLGAYLWLLQRSNNKSDKYSSLYTTTIGQSSTRSSSEPGISVVTGTKNYTSSDLSLSLSYPRDWSINETSGVLTGHSPVEALKSPDGKDFKGQLILTISGSQQSLTGFNNGDAVAVLSSEPINYTKPSPDQRPSTNVSFLRYANSSPGSLSAIYITGYIGYQPGQLAPEINFTSVNPIISVTFTKCVGNNCQATSINPSMWKSTLFSDPILSIFRSLIIS